MNPDFVRWITWGPWPIIVGPFIMLAFGWLWEKMGQGDDD